MDRALRVQPTVLQAKPLNKRALPALYRHSYRRSTGAVEGAPRPGRTGRPAGRKESS